MSLGGIEKFRQGWSFRDETRAVLETPRTGDVNFMVPSLVAMSEAILCRASIACG